MPPRPDLATQMTPLIASPSPGHPAAHKAQRRRHPLWRAARALALTASLALPLGVGYWGLKQNPLTLPMVERGELAASRALEQAFHAQFTPDWVARELGVAIEAGDEDRALWLADLAEAEGIALPPELTAPIATMREEAASWMRTTQDCAVCAYDIRSCGSIQRIAICNIPLELTPVGDITALIRQGTALSQGDKVDKLETGLALVGLGATALVLASGGSSLTVKAGASALKSARRLGSLTPEMTRVVMSAADLPINWGAVARAAPLDEITDVAKLSRLGRIAEDIGRVARNTSPAETLVLLRHVDTAEDTARLARFTDVAKTRSYSRIEVLGKSRAFRTMVRLSDVAITSLAAIYAGVVSFMLTLASWVGRRLLRVVLG